MSVTREQIDVYSLFFFGRLKYKIKLYKNIEKSTSNNSTILKAMIEIANTLLQFSLSPFIYQQLSFY